MQDEKSYIPYTGYVHKEEDSRNFDYKDVCGGDPVFDWQKGISNYATLGIKPIKQDQGASLSCTGQGSAQYIRGWLYKLGLIKASDAISARRIYAKVFLPQGGASIGDAMNIPCTEGSALETDVPDYDLQGNPLDEAHMRQLVRTLDQLANDKKLDKFTRRFIAGGTSNINIYAVACRDNLGLVAGFTGTNQGWTRPIVRPPQKGETRWGHCVALLEAGVLDVDVNCGDEVILAGTKCLFTPNSWGGNYAIKTGRWAGYQGIPETYFLADDGQIDPASGQPSKGIFVMTGVVAVPDQQLPQGQDVLDFLKKNDLRLAQDSQGTGAFAFIKGGKLMIGSNDRMILLLATWAMKNNGSVSVPHDMWQKIIDANLSTNF